MRWAFIFKTMAEKTETINSKIDLLRDQIDNLERSGFFTEAEMEKLSRPFRLELGTLMIQLHYINKALKNN